VPAEQQVAKRERGGGGDTTAPAVPAATSSHDGQRATAIAAKAAYVTAAKAKSADVSRAGGWPVAAVSIPQPNSTTVPVSTAGTRCPATMRRHQSRDFPVKPMGESTGRL
jgi:hypothetical protein